MGARAIAALRKFQADHSLPVTGQLDGNTLDALNHGTTSEKKPTGPGALSSPQAETATVSEMKPRKCDTKDTKVLVTTEEKGVTVNAPGAGSEYHYGQLVTTNGLFPTYWCTGAIWVFSGHVVMSQATFDGSKDNPLRFELKEAGLTYVAGQGSVVLRDGTQKRLGKADGVTEARATAATSITPAAAPKNSQTLPGDWLGTYFPPATVYLSFQRRWERHTILDSPESRGQRRSPLFLEWNPDNCLSFFDCDVLRDSEREPDDRGVVAVWQECAVNAHQCRRVCTGKQRSARRLARRITGQHADPCSP